MSEEEKQAIEEAKKQIEKVHNLNNINIFMTDSSTLKILLHLIDRQQKENEEYRELLLNTAEIENRKVNKYWLVKIKEFKDLLLKELDRDFVTEEFRQSISCYFDNLLKENNNE